MWRQLARAARERGPDAVADWLILIGGVGLLLSLFFTWSHQFSSAAVSAAGDSGALRGVPADPTGWQVYAVADELLAVLAVALVLIALVIESVRGRVVVLLACVLALVFVLHATGVPPTNGVVLINGSGNYVRRAATAGFGETVALVSLGAAVAGLGLSLLRK